MFLTSALITTSPGRTKILLYKQIYNIMIITIMSIWGYGGFCRISLRLPGTRASSRLTTTVETRASLFRSRPECPTVIISVWKYWKNNRIRYGLTLWFVPKVTFGGSGGFLSGAMGAECVCVRARTPANGLIQTKMTEKKPEQTTGKKKREKRLLWWKSREKRIVNY